MKPIGFNHLARLVYEDSQHVRYCNGYAESSKSEAEFLRIDPLNFESYWLCSVAYVAQSPGSKYRLNAPDFFKLCARHLPIANARQYALHFAVHLAHAYALFNGPALSRANAQLLNQTIENFEILSYEKVFSPLGEWRSLFHPLNLAKIYHLALNKTSFHINKAHLNPLIGAPMASVSIESSIQTESSDSLCWPLRPESQLPYAEHYQSFSNKIRPGSVVLSPESILKIVSPTCTVEELSEPSIPQLGQSLPYQTLSSISGAISCTPFALHSAQEKYFSEVRNKFSTSTEWDQFVGQILGYQQTEQMAKALSPEQIDACGLALLAFEKYSGFIVNDETGLGKGRILAAIAQTFLSNKKRVVFITERKLLFSDFWRDLIAVSSHKNLTLPLPFLMHPQGQIFDANGALIHKSPSLTKYQASLEDASVPEFIFATYSQFNKLQKTHPRWKKIQNTCKDALLILDESHVAAGDSQTKQNIKQLINLSSRTLYSSATYAKDESALELYLPAMPLKKSDLDLMLHLLPSDTDNTLAKAISYALTANGCIIRREHASEAAGITHVHEVSGSHLNAIHQSRDQFSLILENLFILASRYDGVAKKNEQDNFWVLMGGVLSRLCRQHALLCKIPALIDFIKDIIAKNQKPVIALQSTFESFLSQLTEKPQKIQTLISDESSVDDNEISYATHIVDLTQVSFARLFENTIASLFPLLNELFLSHQEIAQAHTELLESISKLPLTLASPIDLIHQQLKDSGIRSAEISGRTLTISKVDNHQYSISNMPKTPRESVIRDFNSGQLDVLILTVAGATGISVHSSVDFEDSRQRAFIEVEIASNPIVRQQFLGRTRRRGQLHPPANYIFITDDPFEKRMLERATKRLQKLDGLSKANSQLTSGPINLLEVLLSPYGNQIVMDYLAPRPQLAQKMGLDLWHFFRSQKEIFDGPAERLLKRMPLLSPVKQTEILSFIENALTINAQLLFEQDQIFKRAEKAVLVRKKLIWGDDSHVYPKHFEPVVSHNTWLSHGMGVDIGLQNIEQIIANAPNASYYENLLYKVKQALQGQHSHPAMGHMRKNLLDLLVVFKPGVAIQITDPQSSLRVRGIAISLTPPDALDLLSHLSLWKLQIALPRKDELLTLSLLSFFTDPHAFLDSKLEPLSKITWNAASKTPLSFHTLSGHTVYSKWWSQVCTGKIQMVKIRLNSLAQEVVFLPEEYTSEMVSKLSIPLLNPKITLELLLHDGLIGLYNHANSDLANLKIFRKDSGWALEVSQQYHDAYIDFPLDQRLGKRKYISSRGTIERYIIAKHLRYVLTALHGRGVTFFAPHSRKNWHQFALTQLLHTKNKNT